MCQACLKFTNDTETFLHNIRHENLFEMSNKVPYHDCPADKDEIPSHQHI